MKKKAPHDVQLLIGTFRLGDENVDLYALPHGAGGGEFYTRPDDKSVGRIKIGIDEQHYDDVLAILLHETFEYLACRHHTRFSQSLKFNRDHADYLFIMDHSTFGEICSRQAFFLYECGAKLHATWKKHRPKK
jgi:hypothetical protein